MVSVSCLELRNSQLVNTWVIGTPPAVSDSKRFSTQIQIKYNSSKEKPIDRSGETYHRHIGSIEEYYLVLEGSLTLIVGGKPFQVRERELFAVPAHTCHKVTHFSDPVEYLTIRAPHSTEQTKVACHE